MDFNFDTGSIYGGLQTLDVTTLPPLGGTAGVLTVLGNGALTVPLGSQAQRPATPATAMFRFNTDTTLMEYYDGTQWSPLSTSSSTVSSVAANSNSSSLTITGSPITSAGTFQFTLDAGLEALGTFNTTGVLVATGANTWASRTIVGTAGNIVVTNGDGVAGNPTLDLAAVSQTSTGNFVKVTLDGFGRVTGNTPVVQSDITTLVDSVYVNVAGDTMTGDLSMGGNSITNLATPVNGTDAVNKDYADALANGLSWKTSVAAATTGNITLSGTQTIDGVALVAGQRVLVKDQTVAADNGIYVVDAGAWVRAADMDSTTPINEINGAAVFVEQGTLNADTAWVQIDDVQTLGVDPLQFVQFAGPGSYTAGNGLQLVGNQFSLISPVSVANGGTGTGTAPTNGQLLVGNGTGYSLASLTAGSGIAVNNGAGSITIDNTGVLSITGTANQITASASTGNITLSVPSTFIAPGSVEVTTTLAVDRAATINPALTTGNIGVGLTIYGNTATDLQDWISNNGSTVFAKFDPAGDFYLYSGFGDSTNSKGTAGQILTSTGSAVEWMDPPATGVTSFSAGTTGFTPNTATTGAVTLAGTLNVANGGTGLTSLGTADQFLSVNAGATGLEYKTISAGTGISVTPGANVLTISNTGVTSVGLADGSTTPIYTITNSPVTTTGTLTFTLNSQTANTVFAAPGGINGEPSFRSLTYADLPLQLYSENPSTVVPPSATGDNAVAIGSGSTSTADGTFGQGAGSNARVYGQRAYANGSFSGAGDAQHGVYVARNETTDATVTELFLDGAAVQLVMPDNSVFTFDILVAARRTDATGGAAAYRFVGIAKKDATAGSVTFVGTPSKTIIGETNLPWDANVSLDTSTGAFRVIVAGEAAKTIRWVATIQTTEVTN